MSNWPHSPLHCLEEAGAYIVTAGTYHKEALFKTPEQLTHLQDQLLALAEMYGWRMQAWAVFSNHYHFVALSPNKAATLKSFIRHLHSVTARELNRQDAAAGRKVWHEYWETHLTFETSYLARLHYVHQNPVKHGLTPTAAAYPYCSASWFERNAEPSFYHRVIRLKTDGLDVPDLF